MPPELHSFTTFASDGIFHLIALVNENLQNLCTRFR